MGKIYVSVKLNFIWNRKGYERLNKKEMLNVHHKLNVYFVC